MRFQCYITLLLSSYNPGFINLKKKYIAVDYPISYLGMVRLTTAIKKNTVACFRLRLLLVQAIPILLSPSNSKCLSIVFDLLQISLQSVGGIRLIPTTFGQRIIFYNLLIPIALYSYICTLLKPMCLIPPLRRIIQPLLIHIAIMNQ